MALEMEKMIAVTVVGDGDLSCKINFPYSRALMRYMFAVPSGRVPATCTSDLRNKGSHFQSHSHRST